MTNVNPDMRNVLGVPGRFTHETTYYQRATGTWFKQRWISQARAISGYGAGAEISAEIRYDDECGNGHNSFAITGTITIPKRGRKYHGREEVAGGCLHDEIARAFPEFAPLIQWHLCSSDGPMHYLANAIHFAGDRDCWGLRKGESRQNKTRDGLPIWDLVAVNSLGVKISGTPTGLQYLNAETLPLFILEKSHSGDSAPATPVLKWIPSCRIGEGKARELDSARNAAIWPEATDAELCVEPDALRAALAARLPALLERFRAAIEGAGFQWESPWVAPVATSGN